MFSEGPLTYKLFINMKLIFISFVLQYLKD